MQTFNLDHIILIRRWGRGEEAREEWDPERLVKCKIFHTLVFSWINIM